MCCLYFNKMEGENKPPGGMRKHEKKGRRYALYEWMWWGVTVGLSRIWTCNTAAFATRCMRLLSASRPNSLSLRQWAWWRKLACISRRKPREYSLSIHGLILPVSIPIHSRRGGVAQKIICKWEKLRMRSLVWRGDNL